MSEWEIRQGNCLDLLRAMPDGSVQCCVTSPPYWGLRDYGQDGQLGLEETPDEYVAGMVTVFREVRRVLRDDGTLWLNLGDSYAADRGGSHPPAETLAGGKGGKTSTGKRVNRSRKDGYNPSRNARAFGLKHKDLVGVPWSVAFALRADGWYLRSEIIWSKPNPMPESVRDRPTKAHEQVFLLTKSARYFYDADAVREPLAVPLHAPGNKVREEMHSGKSQWERDMSETWGNPLGRNKRTVWDVTSHPFKGAHFATFPPKLIEPMILAGSPPKCCGVCGAPWQRVTERTPMVVEPSKKRSEWQATDKHAATQTGGKMVQAPESRTVGWEPTCEHNDDTGSSVVLDPFSGSGTTGMVALRHDRSYLGLELNPEYVELSRDRIRDDAPLLNAGIEVAA